MEINLLMNTEGKLKTAYTELIVNTINAAYISIIFFRENGDRRDRRQRANYEEFLT